MCEVKKDLEDRIKCFKNQDIYKHDSIYEL